MIPAALSAVVVLAIGWLVLLIATIQQGRWDLAVIQVIGLAAVIVCGYFWLERR